MVEVFQGDLVKHFVASLERKQNILAQNINGDVDMENLKSQISNLKYIGEEVGVCLQELAITGARNATQKAFFYSATNVAGGNLHDIVYSVGKLVGFKFKPWGAVNLAKNIGNFAKILGPSLLFIGVALEIADIMKQREREQQMADARRDITSQFQAVGKDLESQLGMQLSEFNAQFYGGIEEEIAAARQQQENAIASSNTSLKELIAIRQEFEVILRQINLISSN